jgi:hypothetical protein
MGIDQILQLISTMALVFSATVVVVQLRNVRRDRFIHITNGLFYTWQSSEFMKAQQWVIHEMPTSWSELKKTRGTDREADFVRVTAFYNRIGTIVTLGLDDGKTILSTIGGTARDVWNKIQPLLDEARQEDDTFLQDFERLLPFCDACAKDRKSGDR